MMAGLRGTWGEWHTHPRNDLWASRTVQREVLDAYESAFRRTPVLLRHPAGPVHPAHTDNASRAFGYHDDSFAFATRHTGRPGDSWYFESLLRAAGPRAMAKWRTHPIGGEIRPEVWTCVWDQPPCTPPSRDFAACVEATHVSWLMDSGTFGRVLTDAMRERAATLIRRMGYELQVTTARLGPARDSGTPELSLTLTNHGVAPFCQPWPVELAARSSQGTLKAWTTRVDPRQTHPESTLDWRMEMDSRGLTPGPHRLLLRVRNPLENGRPFRFANAGQDRDLPGWLTLGTVEIH